MEINSKAITDLKGQLENMSEGEKNKLIDEVNALPDDAPEGNTVISALADDAALKAEIDKMSPKEIYEQNVAANFRSCFKLQDILPTLSKKNLIKVLIATVKLPESNAVLKFGGTPDQIKATEWAFIQSQVAGNSKTYITSIDAAARAKYEKLKEKEAAQAVENTQTNETE